MSIPLIATLLAACAGVVLGQVGILAVNVNADEITTGTPLDGFVSYSIEFASFPDFAGSSDNPNTFSNTLINNLGYLQGANPYIRVGGNTQDYAIYDANETLPLRGIVNTTRSADYPTTITIGPSFFDAYNAWPKVKFSHGFNLGGNNDSRVLDTLNQTVPLACNALSNGNIYLWEYGNEPDLFATSAQGPVRPANYNESDYVNEWQKGTHTIRELLEQYCPDLLSNDTYGYLAPSFAGTNNHLKAPRAWSDGLDADGDIKYFSSHNVDTHVSEYNTINPGIPHIFGETNSLYNQGRPGLSNTFGAALWGVDFLLYSASVNIQRVHLHVGTNYRYQSWQPITTNITSIGTKAPYYGNIAVAAFLGNLGISPVQIAELDTGGGDHEAAYLAYVDNVLRRVMFINLNEYNYTLNGTGPGLNPEPRTVRTYSLNVGNLTNTASVQRLYANGSDAITGITWDGYSYNYELDEGRPVRLDNVTYGEKLNITGGIVQVGVADSQVVIVDLDR
ncbi:beta-glucuronidase [Seiridium cupressi]